MNQSLHDSENNEQSLSGTSSYAKSSLFNLSEAGALKINNTQLVIRPNYGKVDLKLFVGQLPKEWDDEMVSQFFSGYGEILESQIIRDGKSGASRGCAFVKFASMSKAEEAKKMIDSKRITLPGVNNPIQIRWADGEDQRLGVDEFTIPKLFVGSIPKNANEDNLKDIFSQFGTIEELVMMRDPDNTPKGSAFVKFKNKEDAILAIRFVNGNLYMNGSDRPMEVRFAENKKKPATETTDHYTKPHHSAQSYASPMPQPVGMPYYKYTAPDGTPYYLNPYTQATQWEEPPAGSMVYPEPPGQPYVVKGAAAPAGGVTGAKKQGPAGANLFIFHIPNEWREEDLYNQFKDFGNIISCRIMTDKQTHRSRGFGFVSYDSARAAQNAIQRMNGFQAGAKKLKVQIKKGEGDEEAGMSGSYGGNKFTPY